MLVLHTAVGLPAITTAERVNARRATARGAALRPKDDAEATSRLIKIVRGISDR